MAFYSLIGPVLPTKPYPRSTNAKQPGNSFRLHFLILVARLVDILWTRFVTLLCNIISTFSHVVLHGEFSLLIGDYYLTVAFCWVNVDWNNPHDVLPRILIQLSLPNFGSWPSSSLVISYRLQAFILYKHLSAAVGWWMMTYPEYDHHLNHPLFWICM